MVLLSYPACCSILLSNPACCSILLDIYLLYNTPRLFHHRLSSKSSIMKYYTIPIFLLVQLLLIQSDDQIPHRLLYRKLSTKTTTPEPSIFVATNSSNDKERLERQHVAWFANWKGMNAFTMIVVPLIYTTVIDLYQHIFLLKDLLNYSIN